MHPVRAQRAQAESIGHGRVDAAADKEEYAPTGRRRANLILHRANLAAGSQSFSQWQISKMKLDRNLAAARRMRDLGMKLHA